MITLHELIEDIYTIAITEEDLYKLLKVNPNYKFKKVETARERMAGHPDIKLISFTFGKSETKQRQERD